MASNSGASWADKWDNKGEANHVEVPEKRTVTLGGDRPKSKYSQKMEDGLGKTKAVASRGLTKVKVGASVSVQWIKNKYHKTTRKH